jgi:hypothetical protein
MRCFCFLLLACTLASGQEMGELSTERPGFTATSGAVGLGVLQLEQGYTFTSSLEGGTKTDIFTGPQAVLRFGLTDAFEVRFSTNGYSLQTEEFAAGRSALSGANDLALGAKLRVVKQSVLRPEIAVTGSISLPSHGSPFTTSGHDPAFVLAAYKDLPGKFSVAANYNVASVTDPRGRFFSSAQSLFGARSVGRGLSLFGEAFHTSLDRAGSEVAVDGGFFRGIGKHAQIDLAAGHTVAGERPSWFAVAGIVLRLPRALLH